MQLLLGHTKIESTVRYLGIEVDDALAIAEQVDVRTTGAKPNWLCPSFSFGLVPKADLARCCTNLDVPFEGPL